MHVLAIKLNVAIVLSAPFGSRTGEIAKRLAVGIRRKVQTINAVKLLFGAAFNSYHPQVVVVGLVYQVNRESVMSGKNK